MISYLDTGQNVSHDDLLTVVFWEILTEFLKNYKWKCVKIILQVRKEQNAKISSSQSNQNN